MLKAIALRSQTIIQWRLGAKKMALFALIFVDA